MLARYRSGIAATWLFILMEAPGLAQQPNHHPHAGASIAITLPAAAALPSATMLASGQPLDLYSRRALRRARTIMQLKLLDIRKEQLACVYEVLERRLPPEVLWNDDTRAHYSRTKPACLGRLW